MNINELNLQLQNFEDDGILQLFALEQLNHVLNMLQQGQVRLSPLVSSLIRIVERSQNNQALLMAVRAINNILELEPRTCAEAIDRGLVQQVCKSLLAITDLDLAGQCIQCIKKLGLYHVRDVVPCLQPITTFFDLFQVYLQRTAMETCAMICFDCGKQVDDGVHVLRALPNLVKLCKAVKDEKLCANLSLAISHIVSSYTSPMLKRSPLPLALRKMERMWAESPSRNPQLEYVELNLSLFEAKVSPKWRKLVLFYVAKERAMISMLTHQKDFQALARLCHVHPGLVIPKLNMNWSDDSFTNLDTLKLLQSILPVPPNSIQIERMMVQREKYDKSLEAHEGETVLFEDVPEEVAKEDEILVVLDNEEEDLLWECSVCTLVNSASKTSCEVCDTLRVFKSLPEVVSSSATDAEEMMAKLSDDTVLAQEPTLLELYRLRPYLLHSLFLSVFPALDQVASKSANPDFRTRSLSCLASLVSIVPRALIQEKIEWLTSVSVISSNLVEDNVYIVASGLRLALVLLVRLGLTVQMQRHQIPELVEQCLQRFPESKDSRIASLRRRALAFQKLVLVLESDGMSSNLEEENTVLHSLQELAQQLDQMEEDPPATKRARVALQQENDYLPFLQSFHRLLTTKGVLPAEYIQSGLSRVFSQMITNTVFAQTLLQVFKSDLSSLIRLLQDSLQVDLPVLASKTHFQFLFSFERIVCQPSPTTMLFFNNNNSKDADVSFSFKADPLLSAGDLEAQIWNGLKGHLSETSSSQMKRRFFSASLRRSTIPLPNAAAVALQPNVFESPLPEVVSTQPSSMNDRLLQPAASADVVTSPPPADEENGAPQVDNSDASYPEYFAQLEVGQLVTRGRDWKGGDQDGGAGFVGFVVDVHAIHVSAQFGNRVYTGTYTDVMPHSIEFALAPKQRLRRILAPSGKSSEGFSPHDESFSESLSPGSLIDAMDSFFCWFPAVVRTICQSEKFSTRVRVHFEGFSPRFDEWIPLTSLRLAPRGSKVFDGGFVPGERDDFGSDIYSRDTALHMEDFVVLKYLKEYTHAGTKLVPNMPIRFYRKNEEKIEEGTIMQLAVELDESDKEEDAVIVEESKEQELVDLAKRVMVKVNFFRRKSGNTFGEDEEEEEERNDDEDEDDNYGDESEDVEWIEVSDIHLFPEKEEEGLVFPCFARVAIQTKEAWIPVIHVQDQDENHVLVQANWDKGEVFSTHKSMLQRQPPRQSFVPTVDELKTLVKLFREMEERTFNPHKRVKEEEDAEDQMEGEEEEEEKLPEIARANKEEEEEDEDNEFTRLAADPEPVKETTFNPLRARTVVRSYPFLDLGRLSRLMSYSFEDGHEMTTPVRLLSRKKFSDSLFLCKSRCNSSTLLYALDLTHPVCAPFRMHHDVLAGNATVEDGVWTVNSTFPTVSFYCRFLPSLRDWLYVVDIVDNGLAQIGFCDAEFASIDDDSKGCGDDKHSWAFDGKRQLLWHDEVETTWGPRWKVGDKLGVGCRLLAGGNNMAEIYYTLNGKDLGVAFSNIKFTHHLRPCVTFNKSFSFRVEWDGACFKNITNSLEWDDQTLFQSALDVSTSPDACAMKCLQQLHTLTATAADFVNPAFAHKLSFQLEQSLNVLSLAFPKWVLDYPRRYGFLFPLILRFQLFHLTAFGVDRAVSRLCLIDLDGSGDFQPVELRKQRVTVPRKAVLESAVQLFSSPLLIHSRARVGFEFAEEIGHGYGPTVEFYSLLCRELCRKDLGLWRGGNELSRLVVEPIETADDTQFHLFVQDALFPAPLSASHPRRTHILTLFELLGQVLARALMDDRPLELNFHPAFLSVALLACGGDGEFTTMELKEIDSEFAKHHSWLEQLGREFSATSDSQRRLEIEKEVESLGLDNTCHGQVIPGFPHQVVAIDNVLLYCRQVNEFLTNVVDQVQAVQRGFSSLFPMDSLGVFSAQELQERFAGDHASKPFDVQEIEQAMVLRGEYTKDSLPVQFLLQVLGEMDLMDRKLFLRFLTGSSRLPSFGGWKAFKPRFTVTKKVTSSSSAFEDLPTCSTCFMELKLPSYSSKEILREKLLLAIREGQNYFAAD